MLTWELLVIDPNLIVSDVARSAKPADMRHVSKLLSLPTVSSLPIISIKHCDNQILREINIT